jgi:hypothetical protein
LPAAGPASEISPNRHLDEFGIVQQVEVGRSKLQVNRFFNILVRFRFGVSK